MDENPTCKLLVDNQTLTSKVRDDLHSVSIQEDLNAPAMFTIELNNWDMEKHKLTWSDSSLFEVGTLIEISMGYANRTEQLMLGEVTGLEAQFSANSPSTLTVRGHDLGHWLMRGRKTRTFKDRKDSQIAEDIAKELGLNSKVEHTEVTLKYAMQRAQTDLAFLQARAQAIGYVVFVRGKTLHFIPHQNGTNPVLTLSPSDGLSSFSPGLSSMRQVGEIAVTGWDPKEKKAFSGSAKANQQTATMGTDSGPKEADKAFGKHVTKLPKPVFSQAQADLVASGVFNEMSLAYITGHADSAGNTKLRAGTVVEFKGFGQRFSGDYYIVSASHTYSPQQGSYRTSFSVERNGT